MLRPTKLSFAQRAEIFDKTVAKVTKDYFDPKFNGVDWPKLARERRDGILSLSDSEAFELAMHDLVRSLGTSHTGFFHQSVRRVPARLAIGATFGKADSGGWPDLDSAGCSRRWPRTRCRAAPSGRIKGHQRNCDHAAKSADVSDGRQRIAADSAGFRRSNVDRYDPTATLPEAALL